MSAGYQQGQELLSWVYLIRQIILTNLSIKVSAILSCPEHLLSSTGLMQQLGEAATFQQERLRPQVFSRPLSQRCVLHAAAQEGCTFHLPLKRSLCGQLAQIAGPPHLLPHGAPVWGLGAHVPWAGLPLSDLWLQGSSLRLQVGTFLETTLVRSQTNPDLGGE